MEEEPLAIYCRISAIEFVLEVLVANHLARMSEDISAKFKKDLSLHSGSLPPRSGPVDVELLQELARRTQADLENFARKVADREQLIRAQIARAP